MRGCGTIFKDDAPSNNVLTDREIQTLKSVDRLASKYEFIANQLKNAIKKCYQYQTTEGLEDMVAFSFNAQQYQPSYGGGGANLPPGKYKGVIVNSEGQNAQSGQGGFLALTLTPIEGPLQGQKHVDRLNLHHTNPKTVEIANQQMSAYCHVTGVYSIQDTAQLHNIPFCFEIGWQKGQEPGTPGGGENGGYTEVKAIYDVNGNAPGKAGAGPQAQANNQPPQNSQPPAGVAPQGGGNAAWGAQQPAASAQQPPQQAAAWGAGAAPAQQPQQTAAPAQAAWGGAPAQQGGAAGAAPWGAQ